MSDGGFASQKLSAVCQLITDGSHFSPTTTKSGLPYVTVRDISDGRINISAAARISIESFEELERSGCRPWTGDVLFSKDGTVGKVALVETSEPFVVLSSLAILRPEASVVLPAYLAYCLQSLDFQREATGQKTGLAIKRVVLKHLKNMAVPVPPLPVQRRIVDLMTHLDSHTANLRAEREALMRSISVGCRVLTDPEKCDQSIGIANVVEILDSRRVPINESERLTRLGDVPYYGANGQVGWIDEPIFNDTLVLLAEDGGPISEWATRPQAYEISGPAWVNNHAHVLRATGVSHDWLLYSLRHRDLTAFAPIGTRAKLTQKSLREIRIALPQDVEKRSSTLRALDATLQSMSAEVTTLEVARGSLLSGLLGGSIEVPAAYDAVLGLVA